MNTRGPCLLCLLLLSAPASCAQVPQAQALSLALGRRLSLLSAPICLQARLFPAIWGHLGPVFLSLWRLAEGQVGRRRGQVAACIQQTCVWTL